MIKTITLISALFLPMVMSAQTVDGNLKINERPKIQITLKNGNVVDLFKQFKEKKYNITFTFSGKDLPVDEEKREVALFTFTTELYKNGKLVKSHKRPPMPFFPAEMHEPVETFDVINVLTYANGDPLKKEYPGKLESGTYVVVLKVEPVGVKGKIDQAEIEVRI